MNTDKVELGRRLFYDVRLSANGTVSCGTCHQQARAFTDGRARAVGALGDLHPRSSMSLTNVAYNPAFAWADSSLRSLEAQAIVPMLATAPVEMGLRGHEPRVLTQLNSDRVYAGLFRRAFPNAAPPMTIDHVVKAIATFERTLISMGSPYDRYRYGRDSTAISAEAKRGELFFFSGQRGACFQCHGSWNLSGNVTYDARPDVTPTFFNTGLYHLAGRWSYPAPNTGLHALSQREDDVGKFRAPTLRNIAVTAPYMHDGSIATLSEVLDHYARGGRATLGTQPGQYNPNRAAAVHGFSMSAQDKRDVLAFLESLTDSAFLTNPAHSNPWKSSTRP